jgi:hypothetical protein
MESLSERVKKRRNELNLFRQAWPNWLAQTANYPAG